MGGSESNNTMAGAPPTAIAPGQPEIALLFIGVSFAVGAACRQLLARTRIPYTVALLLIGIGLGALGTQEPPIPELLSQFRKSRAGPGALETVPDLPIQSWNS